MKLSGLVGFRPLRAASTSEWFGSFANVNAGLCVHRWQRDGHETIYLVSNAAWMPGDAPVTTTQGIFEGVPLAFPPRFQWSSRPDRDDPKLANGFAPHLNPHDPDEQGGAGIEIHPREGCTAARADSWADRVPLAAYHRGTGLPLKRRDVGIFEYRLDRMPSHSSPEIQRLPMFVRGTEPADLQSYEASDEYHGVRNFMEDLGMWRQERCPLARWRILTAAEDTRIAYTLTGKPQDVGSSWEPFSLQRMLADADANPHTGGRIVRGIAWSLRLGCAAIEIGAPNADEWRLWIAAMLRYVQTVQLPCGAFADATFGYGLDQDEPVYMFDLDKRKGWATPWQTSFLVRAVWEAQKVVPEMHRRCVAILAGAAKIWRDAPFVPDMYGGISGPGRYVVTSFDGHPLAKITESIGPARTENQADTLACFREAGVA